MTFRTRATSARTNPEIRLLDHPQAVVDHGLRRKKNLHVDLPFGQA
jgi:hypothetical protein